MGSRTMMQRRVAHAAAVTALLAALLLAPRADAARLVPAKSAARATPRSRTPFKTAAALESGAPAAGPDATAPLEAGNATVVAAPEPLAALRVLALGDSITQGSVPSENANHPYTLQLQKRLQAKLRRPADVTNAAVGGAGIFAVGFNNPVTLVPYAKEMLAKNAKFDWVICLIGINDLLRMGRPADEVMRGLNDIYTPALASGSNVLAIAPLAAPGFVSK
ncbi:hypothetical protein MNEG_6244 [Monoraphidium neglectum]|uniref:SGNH hydrolase-type esterase domain-containing protein n=1 Tax=Monoraphidium neglectum TaxID=145388 RepID=A0A0D2L3D7_9CHLO|nr:hypothetical protein MNEG_6244 [Monoraphidium neglectum]KIZ01719.1 hypothetical protein MNEG_6244 [Monoraphidium neglectum]|eukprot:XP_013900738.1 hypothetical protein MNEG_6244 [Monoraphidium neglectum]